MSGGTFRDRERARQALPSREQLMAWAAAAESEVLGSDRSRLMQVGITDMAARVVSMEVRIRELAADLQGARRELTEARLRDSRRSVRCRYCGAVAGSACVSVPGGVPLVDVHTARLVDVRRRLGVAS